MEVDARLQRFTRGRTQIPLPLTADAYTISGNELASDSARACSVYNFTNRFSPAQAFPAVARDSRMVFYGLSHFIRNHLTRPVTSDDVDESVEFMRTAHIDGGALPFPEHLWRDVVSKYGGYLPIRIEALPEGSTFFPNEPVIQVTSLDNGYGELAAHIEALLVGSVSIATARLTLERHWFERIREYVRLDYPDMTEQEVDGIASCFIHDFGMRASSCAEESELLGLCHLLVFNGTDTFNAAYLARKLGAEPPVGSSILALAHRIVQGHDTERVAFERLLEASFGGPGRLQIGSYVADCYDFANAVKDLLELYEKNPDATVVVRPDSGDELLNIIKIVSEARAAGYTERRGYEYFGTKYRFIEGNSVTPAKMFRVLEHLKKLGIAPTSWGIFGVGGYLRNIPNRDSLSSAYKLSAASNQPKVKLSEDSGKLSVPGPNVILRNTEPNMQTVMLKSDWDEIVKLGPEYLGYVRSAYEMYYDGSRKGVYKFGEPCVDSFSLLRSRVIKEFDYFRPWKANFGLPEASCLDIGIRQLQDKVYQQHRGK